MKTEYTRDAENIEYILTFRIDNIFSWVYKTQSQ